MVCECVFTGILCEFNLAESLFNYSRMLSRKVAYDIMDLVHHVSGVTEWNVT